MDKVSLAYILFGGLFGATTFFLPIHIMHYYSLAGGVVLFLVMFVAWMFGLDAFEKRVDYDDEEDEFYED